MEVVVFVYLFYTRSGIDVEEGSWCANGFWGGEIHKQESDYDVFNLRLGFEQVDQKGEN